MAVLRMTEPWLGGSVGWSINVYIKKVEVSISGHGIYLGRRFDPWKGAN